MCDVGVICAQAGLSRRQFYETFANREDVFLATLRHIHTNAAHAVCSIPAPIDTVRESPPTLERVLTVYLHSLTEDPDRARVVTTVTTRAALRLYRNLWHQWVAGWAGSVLLSGGGQAAIDRPPDQIVAVVFGACAGLLEDWLRLGEPRPPASDLAVALAPLIRVVTARGRR